MFGARDEALGEPLEARLARAAQAEREHGDGAQTAWTAGAGLPRAELLVRRQPEARAREIQTSDKRKTIPLNLLLHHDPNAHWAAALGTRDIQTLRGRSLVLPCHYPHENRIARS